MKRFRFRLQALLDLRSREAHDRELELAAAAGALSLANQELAELSQRRIEASTLAQPREAIFNTMAVRAHYVAKLDADIADLTDRQKRLADEHAQAQLLYAEALKAQKAIEFIRDKREREHHKAMLVAEEAGFDEIRSALHAHSSGDLNNG